MWDTIVEKLETLQKLKKEKKERKIWIVKQVERPIGAVLVLSKQKSSTQLPAHMSHLYTFYTALCLCVWKAVLLVPGENVTSLAKWAGTARQW